MSLPGLFGTAIGQDAGGGGGGGGGGSAQNAVKDKDLTAPPGGPTLGDRYIVASPATGAWATHENDIAEWAGAAWTFETPEIGWWLYVEDESEFYGWSGAAWVLESAQLHAATHEDGGPDEISVAGLNGILADAQWTGLQVIYLGKHGLDANDGKTPKTAKLTLAAAITAAGAGSAGSRRLVRCLDGGTYDVGGSLEIPTYQTVFAPGAVLMGTFQLNDDSWIFAREVDGAYYGNAIEDKIGATGTSYVRATVVKTSTANRRGIYNTYGKINVNIDHCFSTLFSALGISGVGDGIDGRIGSCDGSVRCLESAPQIGHTGCISNLVIGSMVGSTHGVITSQEPTVINLVVAKLSGGTRSYSLGNASTLNLFVNEITGTEFSGTGTANVTKAGVLPLHAASHQNGGSDEVGVGGLNGLLADPQTPLGHKASHQQAGSDELMPEDLGTSGDVDSSPVSDGAGGLDMRFPDSVTVRVECRKASAGTIVVGKPVYIAGWNSGLGVLEVEEADASDPAKMPAIAIAPVAITQGSPAHAHSFGVVSGFDTSMWSVGDDLFVAAAGGLTNVEPTGTNQIQKIGEVLRSHASLGQMLVFGAGRTNALPNLPTGKVWKGDGSGVAVADDITHAQTTGQGTDDHHAISHAARHQDGGADEVATVTAASGAIPKADGTGKLPIGFMPDSVIGGATYQGAWNASTNTPTLADGTGAQGEYFVVSVAGSQDLGSGSISFNIGDWVIHNGSIYEKVDNTDAISSVFTRTGAVTAQSGDYTHAQIGSQTTDDHHAKLHASDHEPSGADAMAVDAVAGTGSLRTLGTGAQTAAAGNDARLSDARTPTSHKDTHKSGGGDEFLAADLLEAAVKRIETSTGPTKLVVGAVADGDVLKRVGSTLVGQTPTEYLVLAVSDEDTDLTTGTAKLTFRMPTGFTLSDVRASVKTAPTGSGITVDINEGGATVLGTKLTIAAGSKTSVGGTPATITDPALADDAEMTIDIDGIGSTIAGAGLKVTLIGVKA